MNIAEMAKNYAIQKHQGQKRKNGADYVVHPIIVAELLAGYKKSHNIDRLMAAAYMHDLLEDTDTSYYELVQTFGYDIASLVMELTTNEDMKNAIGKEKYLAFKLKDMTSWALAIKLCDRLDNVSDLQDMDYNFRERYIKETVYIIDYLCENRKLSKTHKNIIQDILDTLKKVNINLGKIKRA